MSAEVTGTAKQPNIPMQLSGAVDERRQYSPPHRHSWTSPTPFSLQRKGRGAHVDPVSAATARRHRWLAPLLWRAAVVDALVAVVVTTALALSLSGSWSLGGYVIAGLSVLWPVVLWACRGYDWRRLGAGPDEFQSILQAALLTVAAFGVVTYSFQLLLPRRMVLVAVPLVALGTAVNRHVLRGWLSRRRTDGRLPAPRALVVGDPMAVNGVVATLTREADHGLVVTGACVPLPGPEEVETADVPVLGSLSEVPQVVVDHDIDTVIVAGSQLTGAALRRLSWALERTGAELVVSPGLVEVTGPSVTLRPTAGLSLLHVERPSSRYGRLLGKALLDRVLGTLMLVGAAPVIAVAAVAVRATTPGPAFFAQTRVGLDGHRFTMWKLRTMVIGADTMVEQLSDRSDRDGLMFKMRADPRVTRVGRVLRQFSLDELPQLWNVVRGDMSLVGPRPPLEREYVDYHDAVHRRLRVRPGLTGLWQVSGRADLAWEESMRLDLRYVDNWSISMDAQILWKTVRAVLSRSGAY